MGDEGKMVAASSYLIPYGSGGLYPVGPYPASTYPAGTYPAGTYPAEVCEPSNRNEMQPIRNSSAVLFGGRNHLTLLARVLLS